MIVFDCFFTEYLTAEGYEIIINEKIAMFINAYPNPPCSLIQDNDSKHSSDLCVEALARNNIHWVKEIINIYQNYILIKII